MKAHTSPSPVALDLVQFLVQQSMTSVDRCSGSVICLYQDGAPGLVRSSGRWCRALHDVQMETGSGPVVTTLAQGLPVLQLAGGTQDEWHTRSRVRGVRAVLSLPLLLGPVATGAVTIFWRDRDAVGIKGFEQAAKFSVSAQVLLESALRPH